MSGRMPITARGYEQFSAELKRLKTTERTRIARDIEVARAHGDLSENADYDDAKERQGMLEAKIAKLESDLALADIIDITKLSGDRIVFGATVQLLDQDEDTELTVTLVGELEADVKNDRISVTSPIARALIGKRPGDEISVDTPGGERNYEIIDVRFEG
ncbi:MAG: transcription elongation factor GreA [Myxococcales bacterium]|nr:transcription elongation factor GreA [Myxococcales bacterium]